MTHKVVFILGLSRVGSTILDMTLGARSPFVGVGELYEVFRPEWAHYSRDLTCSCGAQSEDCPFWGQLRHELKAHKDVSAEEKYQLTLNYFFEQFGEESIMVDSSKLINALQALQNTAAEVKVIHLVRDVRAWTVSRLNDRVRRPHIYRNSGYYPTNLIYRFGWKIRLIRPLLPWLTRRASYYFWLWHFQNSSTERYLETNNIDYLRISYEGFALEPETTIMDIVDFVGAPWHGKETFSAPIPSHSHSHILVGNPGRHDHQRLEKIRYDYRWFYDHRWHLPWLFFPVIARHNKRLVYGQ